MVITIKHKAHLEMVPLHAGEEPEPGEQLVHIQGAGALAPAVLHVRRHVEDNRETIVSIPDEAVARMATDFAQNRFGLDKPTRDHLHEIMTIHLQRLMTESHSHPQHWTDISVDSDKKLEKHLKEAFLS